MGFLFDVFPIIFFAMFILVFGVIISTLFRGLKQSRKNDRSPRLTVEATVVSKRMDYRRGVGDTHRGWTRYYATFQVTSGDRMELQMDGYEYGMLVEGDRGQLSFQGTRYLGFVRT